MSPDGHFLTLLVYGFLLSFLVADKALSDLEMSFGDLKTAKSEAAKIFT